MEAARGRLPPLRHHAPHPHRGAVRLGRRQRAPHPAPRPVLPGVSGDEGLRPDRRVQPRSPPGTSSRGPRCTCSRATSAAGGSSPPGPGWPTSSSRGTWPDAAPLARPPRVPAALLLALVAALDDPGGRGPPRRADPPPPGSPRAISARWRSSRSSSSGWRCSSSFPRVARLVVGDIGAAVGATLFVAILSVISGVGRGAGLDRAASDLRCTGCDRSSCSYRRGATWFSETGRGVLRRPPARVEPDGDAQLPGPADARPRARMDRRRVVDMAIARPAAPHRHGRPGGRRRRGPPPLRAEPGLGLRTGDLDAVAGALGGRARLPRALALGPARVTGLIPLAALGSRRAGERSVLGRATRSRTDSCS